MCPHLVARPATHEPRRCFTHFLRPWRRHRLGVPVLTAPGYPQSTDTRSTRHGRRPHRDELHDRSIVFGNEASDEPDDPIIDNSKERHSVNATRAPCRSLRPFRIGHACLGVVRRAERERRVLERGEPRLLQRAAFSAPNATDSRSHPYMIGPRDVYANEFLCNARRCKALASRSALLCLSRGFRRRRQTLCTSAGDRARTEVAKGTPEVAVRISDDELPVPRLCSK